MGVHAVGNSKAASLRFHRTPVTIAVEVELPSWALGCHPGPCFHEQVIPFLMRVATHGNDTLGGVVHSRILGGVIYLRMPERGDHVGNHPYVPEIRLPEAGVFRCEAHDQGQLANGL